MKDNVKYSGLKCSDGKVCGDNNDIENAALESDKKETEGSKQGQSENQNECNHDS